MKQIGNINHNKKFRYNYYKKKFLVQSESDGGTQNDLKNLKIGFLKLLSNKTGDPRQVEKSNKAWFGSNFCHNVFFRGTVDKIVSGVIKNELH